MNGLLAHSHNGFFSCGTRKKTFSLLQRPPCCLSSSTRKMWWFCSAYPLLSISSAANGATSEKRWRVSKRWRVALPLFTFLKAPLQAGGNKAELGPLHPPSKEHMCPTDQQPWCRIRGFTLGLDSLLCGCTVPEVNCIP